MTVEVAVNLARLNGAFLVHKEANKDAAHILANIISMRIFPLTRPCVREGVLTLE